MVNENQANLTMPLGIIQRLDKFLETDVARQMGITSRPQAVIMLLREFLDEHSPIKLELEEGELELYDTYDNKIILTDSIKGTIIIEIDKQNKLMCYRCEEDPHNNKYVDFCLKNENLWEFLKSKNVKVVVPR